MRRRFFAAAIGVISLLAASSAVALGQEDPAAGGSLTGNAEDPPPSFSEPNADRSQPAGCYDEGGCLLSCRPRWTASADFIILDRIGNATQTLVERVPRSVPFNDLSNTPGVAALNSNDFEQGFSGGPRVGLIRHGDGGCDFELSYFQIDGWSSDRSVGPDTPPDWLIMRSPGFMQTNQRDDQAMVWDYATKLYNAEFNVRWNPCCRLTVLAGFRWMNLGEHLVGTLNPTTFSWEQSHWNFWDATTSNNLYGFQIGGDGKLWQHGRLSVDVLAKAGIFDNNAEQTTEISVIHKEQRWASASTNRAAFVGESGLQCKYQVGERLLLRAGYEAIWLQGVALAPGQVEETYTDTSAVTVQALGVNCDGGVFYHGATAGLEYSF